MEHLETTNAPPGSPTIVRKARGEAGYLLTSLSAMSAGTRVARSRPNGGRDEEGQRGRTLGTQKGEKERSKGQHRLRGDRTCTGQDRAVEVADQRQDRRLVAARSKAPECRGVPPLVSSRDDDEGRDKVLGPVARYGPGNRDRRGNGPPRRAVGNEGVSCLRSVTRCAPSVGPRTVHDDRRRASLASPPTLSIHPLVSAIATASEHSGECANIGRLPFLPLVGPPRPSAVVSTTATRTTRCSLSSREAFARRRRRKLHGRPRRRPTEAEAAYYRPRYQVEVEKTVEEISG
ncbi:hypothetical protein KM043_018474 [Ampulex compressa]|nr:hypothetical protein KM043_018474 [Ampulex compressa]